MASFSVSSREAHCSCKKANECQRCIVVDSKNVEDYHSYRRAYERYAVEYYKCGLFPTFVSSVTKCDSELRFSCKMCPNPLSKSSRLRQDPSFQMDWLFYLSMKRYVNVYIYIYMLNGSSSLFFPHPVLYIFIYVKRVFILLFHSAPLLNCRQVDVIFHVHVMVLVRTVHTKATGSHKAVQVLKNC